MTRSPRAAEEPPSDPFDDAADRARRLQRVTEALGDALTPQEVLEAILTVGVRAAEARAGAIGVITDDGHEIELLAQRGYRDLVMEDWHRFPIAMDTPMSRVVQSGEPLFISSRSERNELFPQFATVEGDGQALVVLPLKVEGRVIGAMSLSFAADTVFAPERREMKITLARQAAQALVRARAYEIERALRQRMSFLAEASEVLFSSLAYDQTLKRVAQLAVPGLGDWCAIDMVGEDGEIERLAVAHQDPEKVKWAYELQDRYPPRADDPHGVPYVIRTGQPEFFPQIPEALLEEAIGDDQELRRILEQLGLRSTICVPLTARGRTLGAMTMIAAETHPPYTDADFELALELARRAAIAVDNARLFQEAEKGANAARALAYVADGVVLLDDAGIVRHWNPAAAAITGVPMETALDNPVEEMLPAWSTLTAHVPLVRPGEPGAQPAIVPLLVAGQETWVSVSGVEFGEGTVFALRDVTAEQALEKTRSDFVATASHELRTPLAAVYGAVRTLRREDIELSPEDTRAFLEMIETEAVRLAHIVDQILLTGQLDAGAVELAEAPCDLAEVAAGVIESAELHLPDGISLELTTDHGVPEISCDENKLRQVLTNLVDNAIKYSPGGGKVEIRLGTENGEFLIDVVDQGLGIPSGERERIFEKFYRLDPEQTQGVGGSGLGLYICRELVQRMEGRLSVESQPGRGSRFTIALPAS